MYVRTDLNGCFVFVVVSCKRMCASNSGRCIICYEHYPEPIRLGCGCRAENGLAHLDCVLQSACFQQPHRGDIVWFECQTCRRSFTGEMRTGLAEAWVSRASMRIHGERSIHEHRTFLQEWLRARSHLSACYLTQGNYAEAESITRALLFPMMSHLGIDHPNTIVCKVNLALSLSFTGRHVESNMLFGSAIEAITRQCGAEHPDAKRVRCNYASSLLQQGRLEEAEQLNRELLGVSVESETNECTMSCMANLAMCLVIQGRYTEAETTNRRLLATRRRVLGDEHPDTLRTAHNLAATVEQRSRLTWRRVKRAVNAHLPLS